MDDTLTVGGLDIVSAIDEKATAIDLSSHTGNKSNPHGVTKSQIGLGNVENKSSATILGELKEATTSAAGLMSKDDKSKLDGIVAGANIFTLTPSVSSGTKIADFTYINESGGGVSSMVLFTPNLSKADDVTKDDIT